MVWAVPVISLAVLFKVAHPHTIQAGCHVIATAGGPSKVELVGALGADRVIDYRSEDLKV